MEILKTPDSIKTHSYFKNISQELRLKNIDEIRNYLLQEIKQYELMSKKHKKVCTTLNYNLYNCWIYFNFCFCFLAWYPYRNYEFCNRIKICTIAAKIKKYKSVIEKKKTKHNKIVFRANSKLNSIEVFLKL